jgi:hypothetical protein
LAEYSIGTRDILGERTLNEGNKFSNHTTIFGSPTKGEDREKWIRERRRKGKRRRWNKEWKTVITEIC